MSDTPDFVVSMGLLTGLDNANRLHDIMVSSYGSQGAYVSPVVTNVLEYVIGIWMSGPGDATTTAARLAALKGFQILDRDELIALGISISSAYVEGVAQKAWAKAPKCFSDMGHSFEPDPNGNTVLDSMSVRFAPPDAIVTSIAGHQNAGILSGPASPHFTITIAEKMSAVHPTANGPGLVQVDSSSDVSLSPLNYLLVALGLFLGGAVFGSVAATLAGTGAAGLVGLGAALIKPSAPGATGAGAATASALPHQFLDVDPKTKTVLDYTRTTVTSDRFVAVATIRQGVPRDLAIAIHETPIGGGRASFFTQGGDWRQPLTYAWTADGGTIDGVHRSTAFITFDLTGAAPGSTVRRKVSATVTDVDHNTKSATILASIEVPEPEPIDPAIHNPHVPGRPHVS